MNDRCTAAERREQILKAAAELAGTGHYRHVTRKQIADSADIPPSLVSHYFGTMVQLRRALMRYAVKHSHLAIVAQGLASRDAQAMKASPGLQTEAIGSLLRGDL